MILCTLKNMALHIRSDKTDHLARRVSSLTGETLTEAVTTALEQRLKRLERQKTNRIDMAKVRKILDEIHALPILDNRTAEEILGYDENGLPT